MHDVSSGNIYRKIPVLCTAAKCVCIGTEFCDTLYHAHNVVGHGFTEDHVGVSN